MEQIIQAISAKLGLPEAAVRQGAGILLRFIKENAAGTEFEKFAAMLPGASDLAAAAPSGSGGGVLGGLLGAAGGLLGGQSGDLAKVLGQLEGAGITPTQAGALATEFVQQAKTAAGPDLVNSLLSAIPNFDKILKP